MNKKTITIFLLSSVLLGFVKACSSDAEADSSEPLVFSGGITIYSPVNTTYQTDSLLLNLTCNCGAGVKINFSYDLDGKYQGPITLTFNITPGFHMFALGTAQVQLPRLSSGSHRLTVFEDAYLYDYHGANPPGAPFKPTSPDSADYVASWVDTVYFTIDSGENQQADSNSPSIITKTDNGSIIGASPFSKAASIENSWATLTSMHKPRTGARAAAVNGIMYVIGGSQRYNTSNTGFSYRSINSTEAYDPATDKWAEKSPMPTPRDGLGAAAFQGKIYCFGGRNVSKDYSISTNLNEVYDTETDSWETRKPMPTARSGLQASEVGGKIYLIGGWIESESSSTTEKSAQVEIYDPVTDTWATGSPIPTAVAGYASAVMDGKIYVISGVASGSARTNLTQIYHPETDEWSLGAEIPMSVSSAAAGSTTGLNAAKAIYVIGGSNDAYPLNGQFANQVYFPEADSWFMAAQMPVDRTGLAVAVVNDTIFVMGGGHSIFTRDSTTVMQYTPLVNPTIEKDLFPIIPVVIVFVVIIAAVVICILVYSKKRKRTGGEKEIKH